MQKGEYDYRKAFQSFPRHTLRLLSLEACDPSLIIHQAVPAHPNRIQADDVVRAFLHNRRHNRASNQPMRRHGRTSLGLDPKPRRKVRTTLVRVRHHQLRFPKNQGPPRSKMLTDQTVRRDTVLITVNGERVGFVDLLRIIRHKRSLLRIYF